MIKCACRPQHQLRYLPSTRLTGCQVRPKAGIVRGQRLTAAIRSGSRTCSAGIVRFRGRIVPGEGSRGVTKPLGNCPEGAKRVTRACVSAWWRSESSLAVR